MIRALFQRFSIIHCFFLAELILTMLLNVILGNVYRDSMKDYLRLDEFKHQGIYFSTFSDDNMNGSFRHIRKQIEALPSFEGWSNTTSSSTITAESSDSSDMATDTTADDANDSADETVPNDIIISIDKLSSQLFPMEAIRGKWFAEKTSAPRKCIPCVMVDNPLRDCDVGDTLEMDGKKFYVTGIISSDLSYFDIMGEYGNSDTMVLIDFFHALLPKDYRTVLF